MFLPPNADINTAKSWVFLIQNFGAFFGAYSYAILSERTNRRQALGIFFVLAFASIQGMFWTANSLVSLLIWAPILGFCLLGLFAAYTVYFPELYPTRLRTTGCGFAITVRVWWPPLRRLRLANFRQRTVFEWRQVWSRSFAFSASSDC